MVRSYADSNETTDGKLKHRSDGYNNKTAWIEIQILGSDLQVLSSVGKCQNDAESMDNFIAQTSWCIDDLGMLHKCLADFITPDEIYVHE